ncbi:hypothetical protein ACFL2Q_18420, partial [Thermodesulfobacteriota bacterium]
NAPGIILVAGTFPGIRPSDIPSLHLLQAKVVELQMEKMALAVRFKANSRELREKDEQIRGIRKAMEHRVAEHLGFLDKMRQTLAAQIDQCQPGKGPRASSGEGTSKSTVRQAVDEQSPGGNESPYLLRKPFISRKPLLAQLAEFTERMLYGVPLEDNLPQYQAQGPLSINALSCAFLETRLGGD